MKNKIILTFLSLMIAGCAPEKIMVDAVMVTPTPSVDAKLVLDTPQPTTLPEDNTVDIEGKEIIEITEKLFIAQINDIFYNFEDYENKVIVVEGMYSQFESVDGKSKSPVVFRYGPGCCGNDGWGGFLLKYNGEFPNENDWIKVIGTPELIINGVYKDLYLNVKSIEIKSERGAETVPN